MRTIKVFLASSEELYDDRQAFGNLVRKLDKLYEKRGIRVELFEWEDYDAAYNGVRKQDEYNHAIKSSDMFLALFHLKAGKYTIEEFEIATEEYKRTGKNPKSYVYCKDIKSGEQESKELQEFKKRLFDEMGHYWTRYNNGDTMRLHFVLQLQLVEGCQSEKLKVDQSFIKLGDQAIAKTENLSIIANNEDYKRLSERLLQIPIEIEKVRIKLAKHPDDEDYQDDLDRLLDERLNLNNEFERQNQFLLETAMRITQLQSETITGRVQRAIQAFEQGNVREANVILDEAEKDANIIIDEFKKSKLITEIKRQAVFHSIEELILKASTVMADSSVIIEKRIKTVSEIYSQADEMASLADYKEEKYEILLFNYANFISTYGSLDLALKLFQRLYALSENLHGKTHPNLGVIINCLGIVYDKRGEYQYAISYYEKALEYLLDGDVLSRATIYNNIGFAYYNLARYDRAEEYYKQALAIWERTIGLNTLEAAAIYNNIGLLLNEQAKYDESLKFFLNALRIRISILGEEHPEVAKVCGCIGESYYKIGDFSKSLEFENRALAICRQALGINHADAASYYNGIGRAFRNMGETNKALEYYLMAVKISARVFGDEHPDTATYKNNTGILYAELGEAEKALNYCSSALNTRERVFGHNHPLTANSYNSIGNVYHALGNNPKALECFQDAANIRELLFGKNHPDYANSLNQIGIVLLDEGEYKQAISYFTQAISICKYTIGEQSHFCAKTYSNLGYVYEKLEDMFSAYSSYQKALDITEELYGKNHPQTANLYYLIGGVLYSAGEYVYAVDYANNALSIWSSLLGDNSIKVAECYEALAEIILALNNNVNALELFGKALSILLKHYDENSSRVRYIKDRIREVSICV